MISLAALLLWLSLAFCLSMTAGGILILFRFRQSALGPSLPFLQFFFILINVFGYYSLWSKILLSGVFAIENAASVANVVSLLGTPFFLIGAVMLLIWACRLQQRPVPPILLSVVAFSLLCALLIWFTGLPTHDPVRGIWSISGLIFYFAVLAIIALGKSRYVERGSEIVMQALVAAAALIHASYFTPLPLLDVYEILFANLFFLFNAALAVFYVYRAPRSPAPSAIGFDALLAKYGISKREADIVMGIYAGKTNQEIANQLFLSLQTVKDHCSRIYQKTFVKNRGQLVALVREANSQSH
jgi:DNA-binding CsgD family transcriptional regulator